MGALRGGLITRRPLALSQDAKHFFAPCGNDIRVYSTVSGDHVATLRGHGAEVTAVTLDPSSVKQVS
jgi:WD40 repeat protein